MSVRNTPDNTPQAVTSGTPAGPFPVGTWAWPADGHADCAGCDHPHSAHPDGEHCLVAAADEWDDCRCARYAGPQAGGTPVGGVR
ncbi:hypothetical protein ACWC5I_20010 [Kitasatospora sp. NPDC001574]